MLKSIYLKNFLLSLLFCILIINVLSALGENVKSKYTYQTFPNDPLNARIYKLDNGLTVYMTVYKDEPRIQTYIAVKAGSKNDPPDKTGLAHYFEHMLFKGTDRYGTKDYEKEKVEIDKIIKLYEIYNATTDTTERKNIYRQIDSVSFEASKYAIANEYDKMMKAIGAKYVNAYTSVEQTVYMCNIPSNQFEKWATIEAERFRNPVMRLFHTELEVVYEEKNMSLDRDASKVYEALYAGLFQKHQYGTQTTIGTVEHLKNPSIKKLIEYYNTYYVPNNMAICISGDFDPDYAIRVIDEKFSVLKPKDVPIFSPPIEEPIKEPIIKEVWGPDAESITIGFRFPGINTKEADLLAITDMILSNNTAGLIDLNLNQKQKVLEANASMETMKDYSVHIFSAKPKEGQTLDEVKDLLLSQIDLVKKGEFPDWLIPAIINDMKLNQIKRFEGNWGRAHSFVNAFVMDTPWEYTINRIDRLSKITKKDIVEFANKYYGNNYVVVYKRIGEDKNVKKVVKPPITPVQVNRTDQSEFVTNILKMESTDIQPVFLDYDKDIEKFSIKNNIPVNYVKNKENEIFYLYYVFDMGTNHNKKLGIALRYLQYLGTSKYTPEQIKQEFYKIGCSFNINSSTEEVQVSLSGLSENLEKGLILFEHLLSDAKPNDDALKNLVKDILKVRQDNKLSKRVILWQAMYSYGIYGKESPYTNILTESELNSLQSQELIDIIKSINTYEHRILYYGPADKNKLTSLLNKHHKVPKKLNPIPKGKDFQELPTTENKIYLVDYDMKQAEIIMLSKGELYNNNNTAVRTLFNQYYGGGMSSVVFQEIREAKALAYSSYIYYSTPYKKDKAHYIVGFIGTQADKLSEAMPAMFDILNKMPESDFSFNSAKDALINSIQTERITKTNILFNYENAKKLGVNYDTRKDVYQNVRNLKIDDLKTFFENSIANKKYTILILGDVERIDKEVLLKYGEVKVLSLEEIFGY